MAFLELIRDDGERVKVDSDERVVYFNGKSSSFTTMEWSLLKGLYFNVGKPVSRDFLLSLLKKNDHNDNSRIVDVHISSLRGKLNKIKLAKIVSVYGFGYVLKPSKKK